MERNELFTGIIFRRNVIIWKKGTVEFYKKVGTIQMKVTEITNYMKFLIETGDANTILRKISKDVLIHELPEYKKIAQEMVRYVKDPKNGWVWLAAPQIGINKRIIALSLMQTNDDENYKTIAMINPEIFQHSQEKGRDEEGCLSVPWEHWDVERWIWVKVRYQDEKGKEQSLLLKNLAARILQHEIDHLDGILFTDKVL